MYRDLDQSSLSELESEYELEMDNTEFESGEDEFEDETGDDEYESTGDYESDDENEYEYEMSDSENSGYAERFYELSQMEFESESEMDGEVNGLLNEMEQDFFFKAARRFIKRRGPGILGKLGKFALSKLPAAHALKGLSQLARGNLKGSLLGLAKTALSSHPAFAAAMPALKALGFESSESPETNREAWDNYVEVAREAYESLAENLNENSADPMVANEVARNALRKAMTTVKARAGQMPGLSAGRRIASRPPRRKRVVYLRPGEYLVVVRKRR